nr:MAG TPA: hypothetical protein [Caudoviricetes sp.]
MFIFFTKIHKYSRKHGLFRTFVPQKPLGAYKLTS